jgi:hypothetical protein
VPNWLHWSLRYHQGRSGPCIAVHRPLDESLNCNFWKITTTDKGPSHAFPNLGSKLAQWRWDQSAGIVNSCSKQYKSYFTSNLRHSCGVDVLGESGLEQSVSELGHGLQEWEDVPSTQTIDWREGRARSGWVWGGDEELVIAVRFRWWGFRLRYFMDGGNVSVRDRGM